MVTVDEERESVTVRSGEESVGGRKEGGRGIGKTQRHVSRLLTLSAVGREECCYGDSSCKEFIVRAGLGRWKCA